MKNTQLLLAPEFLEQANRLDKATKAKLIKCLRNLSANTDHPGLETKKIKGARATVFECRVDRSVRLIYDVMGGLLRCWGVGAHDSALTAGRGLAVDDIDLSDAEVAMLPAAAERYLENGVAASTFDATTLEALSVHMTGTH